jgi:hypothetical protein
MLDPLRHALDQVTMMTEVCLTVQDDLSSCSRDG